MCNCYLRCVPMPGNPYLALPISSAPAAGNLNLLFVSVLDILYKWDHKVREFYVWLFSLSIMFSKYIHVVLCVSQYFIHFYR